MSDSLWPPWTVAYQAPLSMGFSRQEYWSGLPCLSPRDLPDPGIEPTSPALATSTTWEAPMFMYSDLKKKKKKALQVWFSVTLWLSVIQFIFVTESSRSCMQTYVAWSDGGWICTFPPALWHYWYKYVTPLNLPVLFQNCLFGFTSLYAVSTLD